MTRVAVFGAIGRMGRTVCETVTAAPDLELVGAIDPNGEGHEVCGVRVSTSPDAVKGADVMVDFTHPERVIDNIRACVAHGVHCVIGTSGFSPEKLDEVRALLDGTKTNVFVAPNFSVGAVLMMAFARQAAKFMGSCEIVEQHHNQKLDAPSGTGAATARGVADVWREHGRPSGGEPAAGEFETISGSRGGVVEGVHVHSVRLHGLLAHQEVLFGAQGETLKIRHDTMERSSFMPGVLLAVRGIASRPGLTVGLENFMGLG